MSFAVTGQGNGAVGLPGDASPPSRFVKTAIMVANVYPAENARELLNVAQHIINNVDLPAGYVRATENGTYHYGYHPMVVFKDITISYFTTAPYNDMTVRSIDMRQVDFSEHAPTLKMPIPAPQYIVNVTDNF